MMKITKISLFQKDLPYVGGGLAGGDRSAELGGIFDTFNSTVVVIDTDAGISGCGEACPWGASNLGVLAAMPEIAKALLGKDPRELHKIERTRD